MHNFKVGDFVHGKNRRDYTIFYSGDYYLAMVVKESPLTFISLYSRYLLIRNPILQSEEFYQHIRRLRRDPNHYDTLLYKYEDVIITDIDDPHNFAVIQPNEQDFERVRKELCYKAGHTQSESRYRMLPFNKFNERFLKEDLKPFYSPLKTL